MPWPLSSSNASRLPGGSGGPNKPMKVSASGRPVRPLMGGSVAACTIQSAAASKEKKSTSPAVSVRSVNNSGLPVTSVGGCSPEMKVVCDVELLRS